VDDMQADLAQFATGLKGQVRLLCNTSAMTEFLPDALATFLAAHPQLSINLEERLSHDIVQAVADGAADIGIITDAVDRGALQTFPSATIHWCWRWRAATRWRMHWATSARWRSRRRWDMTSSAWPATAPCSSMLRDRRNGWAAACTARSACAALKPSAAWPPAAPDVALLPEAAARRSARLRIVKLSDEWADRKLLICVRDEAALPGYARELVAALAENPPDPWRPVDRAYSPECSTVMPGGGAHLGFDFLAGRSYGGGSPGTKLRSAAAHRRSTAPPRSASRAAQHFFCRCT
jgi:DNA-binding transcriptional LysR family regulator